VRRSSAHARARNGSRALRNAKVERIVFIDLVCSLSQNGFPYRTASGDVGVHEFGSIYIFVCKTWNLSKKCKNIAVVLGLYLSVKAQNPGKTTDG
jgi:hypothetical protein